MGQIFLVRHGQASFGSSNYDQLSARGEEQAALLGQWFAQRGQRFDRVVSGTMTRHRQTAAACIARLDGAPPEIDWLADDGFNEYNHDEVLYRHRPEFEAPGEVRRFLAATENANRQFQQIFEDAMARWMGGAHDAEYRETWPVFRQRCLAALWRLIAASGASQSAVVFTSGGTISTLCQHVLGMPDPHFVSLNWSLVNSAVTKLYYRLPPGADSAGEVGNSGRQPDDRAIPPGTAVTIGYLNNYAHLEMLGDRQAVTYR